MIENEVNSNFKTIGILVFKSSKNGLIINFFGVYIVTYLCYLSGLTIFKLLGINIYMGGAILLLPVGLLALSCF